MVLTIAASVSAQENEPMPKDTSNPKQAFYMSAADLAATAAKLPSRPQRQHDNPRAIRRLVNHGPRLPMAIRRRMQPQNGNAHNTEAEMWFVLDGSGAVTTGGKLVPI
jgi:mannose-6-phosphate isomerase-like protein (cupin superfamily)